MQGNLDVSERYKGWLHAVFHKMRRPTKTTHTTHARSHARTHAHTHTHTQNTFFLKEPTEHLDL